MATKHPQKIRSWFHRMLLLGLLVAMAMPLHAGPTLDTSSPIVFFTNTANLFLKTAGYPFTVSNIPIYPTNCYTPAVHRLLQLAANLYDASTNRAFDDGTSPNGPFYPSVFRPYFFVDANTNVFIAGYVEDVPTTNTPAWSQTTYSLSVPEDVSKLAQSQASQVNIYGIPYVIGARKGFPNFNQFSMQSVSQITRALQIVKPYAGAPPTAPGWQTNLQFTIGISNELAVQAWNSYSNPYPRAVDIYAEIGWNMFLRDDSGVVNFGTTNFVGWSTAIINLGQWAGLGNQGSFKTPILTNIVFLPTSLYESNGLIPANEFGSTAPFTVTTNFQTPHFVLTTTNWLKFVMVDQESSRVIDYVTLDNVNYTRDLAAELVTFSQSSQYSPWGTNLVSPSILIPTGIYNQITASEGLNGGPPPGLYMFPNLAPGEPLNDATHAFEAFLGSPNTNIVAMEAPCIAYCVASDYLTWQANDPLVHYTLPDLALLTPISGLGLFFGSVPQNTILSNLTKVNGRYQPWANWLGWGLSYNRMEAVNEALKDPSVSQSDDWNFPSGQLLSLQNIGSVHRGTPWQTVYLKSAPVDSNAWQIWTGYTNPQDAALTQPTNDWALVATLAPLLNPTNPRQLFSINTTNENAWASVFDGMTVETNTTNGLEPLVIDEVADSNALNQIVAGINATRSTLPGNIFTNLGQILAVPQLSVGSPFIADDYSTNYLTDAAYESLPSQLLPLLRLDSIGSVVNSAGAPQFQFTGVDGYAYNLEASTNLQDWTTIATQQYTTNGILIFTDPTATNYSQRYYRTELAP